VYSFLCMVFAAIQFDEWFLHRAHSPVSSGSRGLCFGEIIQHGKLVASTAQQGLMRPMQQ
jgi:acyl-CoA thioesterase-2